MAKVMIRVQMRSSGGEEMVNGAHLIVTENIFSKRFHYSLGLKNFTGVSVDNFVIIKIQVLVSPKMPGCCIFLMIGPVGCGTVSVIGEEEPVFVVPPASMDDSCDVCKSHSVYEKVPGLHFLDHG